MTWAYFWRANVVVFGATWIGRAIDLMAPGRSSGITVAVALTFAFAWWPYERMKAAP